MFQGLYTAAALLGLSNGLAVLLVNPRRIINQIYFVGTLITGGWIFSMLRSIALGNAAVPTVDNPELLFWVRMNSAIPVFMVWQIASMRSVLMNDIHKLSQALRRSWPWFVVSVALAGLCFSEAFIPSHSTVQTSVRGPGYLLYIW